jgi:hypothetical protein
VSYFSLVDLAVGKRPYVDEDVGHLLLRTNCLAQGETIGHDLCQSILRVNATLRSVGKTWSWGLIEGDRALPFNMSTLPLMVNNDLDVVVVFGDYVIHRLVRFIRAAGTSAAAGTRASAVAGGARASAAAAAAAAPAVQVDHFTKTLSIGGEPFLGSGYYFESYSSADLIKLAGELPDLVAVGVNMGVMLTLPAANASVQQAFFTAAVKSGFKVIYPLFILDGLTR